MTLTGGRASARVTSSTNKVCRHGTQTTLAPRLPDDVGA